MRRKKKKQIKSIPATKRHYKHVSFPPHHPSGIQGSAFNTKVVHVPRRVICVILVCTCNVYDFMKQLWKSKIDLKVAGSLELFITTVSKETTPYSDDIKGFIDSSGRCL